MLERLMRRIQRMGESAAQQIIGRLAGRIANLWRRAFEGVFSKGQVYDRSNRYYRWQLGNTEKHCSDCLHLDGQVHTAEDWRLAGIRPQSPDLECGGWNCDCRLVAMPENYDGGDVGSIGRFG